MTGIAFVRSFPCCPFKTRATLMALLTCVVIGVVIIVVVVVSSKIQQYSPMDFKAYEKTVNRKHGVKFQPTQVLELLTRAEPLCQRNAEHRREIVNAYLNVRKMVMMMVVMMVMMVVLVDDHDGGDGGGDDDDIMLSSSKN